MPSYKGKMRSVYLEKGMRMSFLETMLARAKADKQTIVLPEGNDPGVRIIDPETSDLREKFATRLYELRKHKGMTPEDALDKISDVLYFGVMMVKCGEADGMVSGACHSTGDVLRPCLQILKTAPGVKLASSFFVMVVPDCEYGQNGTFIFSDCGLEVQPDDEALAHIAVNSARSWKSLMGTEPAVAMLSHSSKGSARNDDANKVVRAVEMAHELDPSLELDGELQLDAAIVPSVGESKAPGSRVAGHANVLVFPDLDAGNIGYKLVQRLAKAEAYGPITQGLAAPVNDLSRGCTADDIVGVAAITCSNVSPPIVFQSRTSALALLTDAHVKKNCLTS